MRPSNICLKIDNLYSLLPSLFKTFALCCLSIFLTGCDFLLFDPKGPIGEEQKWLIIFSFLIMMIVVVPVFVMTITFSVRYHKKNKSAEYKPEWSHSNRIEFIVWAVPCAIIIALGIITYKTSHSLDPRQPLKSDKAPLRIHVVALDWKWLFIYPEYEVAAVNEVAMPVDTPVEFLITSDTVMNSFFIPQLGSQIYAMAGMENQLQLMADEPGVYRGLSANYSGFGFSGMKFKALAMPDNAFSSWLETLKSKDEVLSSERYEKLKVKSKDHPVEYFSQVNPLMFNNIIEYYTAFKNGK